MALAALALVVFGAIECPPFITESLCFARAVTLELGRCGSR